MPSRPFDRFLFPILSGLLLLTAAVTSACLQGEDPPKDNSGDSGGTDASGGTGAGDTPDGGGDGGGDLGTLAWRSLSGLNKARAGHSSCAANGRVFVFGGNDGTTHLDSVEGYDPTAGSWTLSVPMAQPRSGAACVSYGSRIYLFGGETVQEGNYSLVAAVNEFNAESMTWTDCVGVGGCSPMTVPRYLLGAALLAGKIYVVGGGEYDGSSSQLVNEYDPLSNTWTDCSGNCTTLTEGRYNAALGAAGGRLILAGGGSPGQSQKGAFAFDPLSNQWTELASMPSERCCIAQAGAAAGGTFYLFGGQKDGPALNSGLSYNGGDGLWKDLPPMGSPRTMAAAAALDGLIYLSGGHDGAQNGAAYPGTTAVFDPAGH